MRILCTMPGKYGDILWGLPTVRAISETFDVQVDLIVSTDYSDHRDLLRRQSYIRDVRPWSSWESPAPGAASWSPFDNTLHYLPRDLPRDLPECDRVFHLGYRRAPDRPLPAFIYDEVTRLAPDIAFRPLDLDRPWIQAAATTSRPVHRRDAPMAVAVGWSSNAAAWKRDVTMALQERFTSTRFIPVMTAGAVDDTWKALWCFDMAPAADWVAAAERVAESRFFVGCCSALHVLACAMGMPALVVEPDENRWDAAFYPYGTDGRVRLVRGDRADPAASIRAIAPLFNELMGASAS